MSTSIARRFVSVVALGLGALFVSTSARASDVQWSVGINAPLYPGSVSTVISNAPRHGYYAPEPRIYVPAPVYYAPRPIYHAPPRHYYRPAPVIVYRGPGYHHHWRQPHYRDRDWQDRDHRGHDRDDRRWRDRDDRHHDRDNHHRAERGHR